MRPDVYDVRGQRIDLAGPKGYEHGWIYVGGPGLPSVARHAASRKSLKVGDAVHHPIHGEGTVQAVHGGHPHAVYPTHVGLKVQYKSGAHSDDVHPAELKGDTASSAKIALAKSRADAARNAAGGLGKRIRDVPAGGLPNAKLEKARTNAAPKVKNPNPTGLSGPGKYGQRVDRNSSVDYTSVTHNGTEIGHVRLSSVPGNQGKYVASAPGRRDTVHDTKQLAMKRLVNEHAAGQLKRGK